MNKLLGVKFLLSDNNGPCFTNCKYDVSGAWNSLTSRKKAIRICEFGYHAAILDSIDYYYKDWYKNDGSCYIVELSGKIAIETDNTYDSKIAAENMRFIHKIKLGADNETNIQHIIKIAKKFKVLEYEDLFEIPEVRGIMRWDAK